MAADKNANIAVRVGADLTPLQRDMKRAATAVDRFGRRIEDLKGPLMAAVGAATAAAAAVALIAQSSSESAREIKNLARLSNVSASDFQKMAFAAKSVGIQQEKLADIFKDAQDKVGDFLVTGGGPLADYFETIAPLVGQTADEFRNLSGAQVLGKFQQGLDAANISLSEQTFFLEALASDSALLQPLLTGNAAGMNALATQADKLNAALGDEQINALAEIAGGFDQIAQQITTETSRAILQFDDEIKSALEGASQGVSLLARGFNLFFEQFRSAENKKSLEGVDEALGDIFERRAEIDRQLADSSLIYINKDKLREERDELFKVYDDLIEKKKTLLAAGQEDGATPEAFALDRVEPTSPIIATEQLAEQIEANKELVFMSHEQLIEMDNQLNTALERQQQMSLEIRRRGMQSALSDAASLMGGNSKKMFEIGKAASIANAVLAGGESAIEAWRSGMETPGPFAPAVAAAYTAASLARTGMMIQKISSTSFGSKSSGGFGGGGGVSAPQGPAAGGGGGQGGGDNQIVNIDLQGEVFGRDQVRGLIGQINDALDDGFTLRV